MPFLSVEPALFAKNRLLELLGFRIGLLRGGDETIRASGDMAAPSPTPGCQMCTRDTPTQRIATKGDGLPEEADEGHRGGRLRSSVSTMSADGGDEVARQHADAPEDD